ncbi:MAG: response regulator [Tolypothrix brevis GSE-NOS-MK-07-07A]|jgi:signal transduction histidine kinase|nr:response regulator [Tolypothrix brevis GSE-NOS-MK-07-07A]
MINSHNQTNDLVTESTSNTFNNLETILVIDDSPTNLEVLHATLENAGYEVRVEMDGNSGIEQVKNNPPDLILLDVMMPGIDGFETCRRLQANPSTQEIPIIFITALSDSVEKVKGLSLGAVDYITKPFNQKEVLARIKLHLKLRQLNLELDEQKQQLEQRVKERTAELSHALEELKKSQLQLVQSEKISFLGQLVTGVAHEVNNPVGFISTNLYYAYNYIQDLINLVKLYQKEFPTPGYEIEDNIKAMDLQHVLEDLPKVLSSMKLGTERIQGIMQSLRNFSRLDGEEKKAVDIHEGLETSLMILQHRLKALPKRPAINVIKEYGNLPKIKCYPVQLNQVFMNLLSNAIDAIEESIKDIDTFSTAYRIGLIRICTTIDKQQVTIKIYDNGIGISESVQNQIFQPFFTTKPEGKGSGLGLSISNQIITEKHGGTLQCISSVGNGTEFVIQIPLKS